MNRSAMISKCTKYRYELRRVWDATLDVLAVIALNPSIADGEVDDHTVRKLTGFARRLGYGGFVLMNLYAYRATNPKDLLNAFARGVDIVGPDNDVWLESLMNRAGSSDTRKLVLCGWGSFSSPRPRSIESRVLKVQQLARDAAAQLVCLTLTQDGNPGHPLMLSYDFIETLSPWPPAPPSDVSFDPYMA